MTDDYTFEDHIIYKQYEKDLLRNLSCKIDMSKCDSWKVLQSYPFWQRVYKRLFPTRFEINRKVKKFMIKEKWNNILNRMDEFIAWGDPMMGGIDDV